MPTAVDPPTAETRNTIHMCSRTLPCKSMQRPKAKKTFLVHQPLSGWPKCLTWPKAKPK